MEWRKIMKRGLVYLIWFIMALVTALTFNSYAVGTDYLYHSWQWFGVIPVPDWTPLTWVSVLILPLRRLPMQAICVSTLYHICPYGRFQSVMFDKDTLIVTYDYKRGEPRGARKRRWRWEFRWLYQLSDVCASVSDGYRYSWWFASWMYPVCGLCRCM